MEELQRHPVTGMEDKPRKVRFKLASSYSGRVLKHVYEDGQELDSPEEQYPRSFIHAKMEIGQPCDVEDIQDPPTGLIAQRINIYRGMEGCKNLAAGNFPEVDDKAPVLDFGKIIIYTSNLKIIRAPHVKAELGRCSHHSWEKKENTRSSRLEKKDSSVVRGSRSRRRQESSQAKEVNATEQMQESDSCKQCGGSGSAPCSLCHGSKLSMLANRFNESIRVLRCPACGPHGLEPCQSCSH